jgi:hypothetical protein
MVWVLLGPLAPSIAADLGLNAAQKGFMVAVPTLAGRRPAHRQRPARRPDRPQDDGRGSVSSS